MHTSIISTVGICLCYVFNFIQIFISQDSMPDLFSHFQYNEIETHMYASQWFLTLFTAKFPLSMVYRIMDLFLCHVSGPAGTQLRNQETGLMHSHIQFVHFVSYHVHFCPVSFRSWTYIHVLRNILLCSMVLYFVQMLFIILY